MSLNSTFYDANWARLERDWTAWWHGALERPLVVLETQPAVSGVDWDTYDDRLTRFPPGVPADAVLNFKQVLFDATRYYADAYPCFYPDFGAGVVAAFLGSRVQHDPLTRTAWFHPLGMPSLADLTPLYDPKNIWWRRVQDVLQTAIGRWGPGIAYGQTDLGGNLDILASLRGTQNLLLDLHDAPAEVDRLVSELTRLWLRYYAALQRVIQPAGHGSCSWVLWYPTSGYMLQSDFSYMISPGRSNAMCCPTWNSAARRWTIPSTTWTARAR